jgi:hypothetical protein
MSIRLLSQQKPSVPHHNFLDGLRQFLQRHIPPAAAEPRLRIPAILPQQKTAPTQHEQVLAI